MQPDFVQQNVSGADLTTMQVGGMVRFFARCKTIGEAQEAIAWAQGEGIRIRAVGAGSNLIIPDEGFDGLLLRLETSEKRVLSPDEQDAYKEAVTIWQQTVQPKARHTQGSGSGVLQLPVEEQDEPGKPTLVYLDAGLLWGAAVVWTLQQNLIGLHWFSRIPCRVGGAIFNNIHGGKHFFSEYIVAVHAIDADGNEQVFIQDQLAFGYDTSLFHQRRDLTIVGVVCVFNEVSPAVAAEKMSLYKEWTQEKTRVQPSGPNCGSVFQNLGEISPELTPLAVAEGITMPEEGWSHSAARYIDLAGGKGLRHGGMQVYPGHANFICNVGKAEGVNGTARELAELISMLQQRVRERFCLEIIPEVEFLA